MELDFAPMEGITGYVYRRAHHAFFGQWTSWYYTPFVVSTWTKKLKSREKIDILPENNAGVPLIPQILSNDAEEFLYTAASIASLGYREVNLNLGCPVGTVTAKKKGSGFLTVPDQLDRFLARICEGAEHIRVTDAAGRDVPLAISVKTRLGFEDVREAERIFAIYAQYPLSKLIIHARTRKEQYAGQPELDVFLQILRASKQQIIYNGNIFTPADARYVSSRAGEKLSGIMAGRGFVADPALSRRIQGGPPASVQELKAFHRALYEGYQEQYRGFKSTAHGTSGADLVIINRMKEVWTHMGLLFRDTGHYIKNIHKAKTAYEYNAAVRMLFANCPLQDPENGIIQTADDT